MKQYIFKKEFTKNIYITNFSIRLPPQHFKKFFNFLDGVEFSSYDSIENYPENRLVLVSSSRLDRPIFNENYNELFSKYVKNLLKKDYYVNMYSEELINKVSKMEASFSEIVKKSSNNDYFLHEILMNIKTKTFLIVTETIYQPEEEEQHTAIFYYVYDITGLDIESNVEEKLNKELEKDGLFYQFVKIPDIYIGKMYMKMVFNEQYEYKQLEEDLLLEKKR